MATNIPKKQLLPLFLPKRTSLRIKKEVRRPCAPSSRNIELSERNEDRMVTPTVIDNLEKGLCDWLMTNSPDGTSIVQYSHSLRTK